jgi:hypothetical protein
VTYIRPRLLERLRNGEVPTRETLPPGLRQRQLVDWMWWPMGHDIAITGHAPCGRLMLTGNVCRIDAGFAWALAEEGFFWLGDGSEGGIR